jgi:hypothetical protein
VVQKCGILKRKQRIIDSGLEFGRRSVKISRKVKVSNRVIRERTGLQNSVLDYIKQNN